jgi:outer membrane protein assembly factor BamB
VEKTSGELVWSTEEIAQPHIEEKQDDPSWNVNWAGLVEIVSVSSADNIVYVVINYESLYALNSIDGQPIWKIDNLEYASLNDDTFTDDGIFVVNNSGNLMKLDKFTGEEQWKQSVVQNVDDHPVWSYYLDHLILAEVYHLEGNQLFAFETNTGKGIWKTNITSMDPYAFEGDAIYFDNSSKEFWKEGKRLTSINLGTGEVIWDFTIQKSVRLLWPTVVGEYLYLVTDRVENSKSTSKLIALGSRTGILLWQFNQEFSPSLDVTVKKIQDDVIYIGTESGFVFALDRIGGQEIWRAKLPSAPSSFFIEGNRLVVICKLNCISGLDSKTGSQEWLLNIDIDTVLTSDQFDPGDVTNLHDGILYGIDKPGVYAVDINTGKVLWLWNHDSLYPWHRGYDSGLVDKDIVYVVGGESPFDIAGSGLFALKK